MVWRIHSTDLDEVLKIGCSFIQLSEPQTRWTYLSSPNHRKADKLGMKKYSPPRSTLKVSIP